MCSIHEGEKPRVQLALPFQHPKECALKSLFMQSLLSPKEKTEQNGIATLALYIYIYIYIFHITHTQFGPLDLMGQSSELG